MNKKRTMNMLAVGAVFFIFIFLLDSFAGPASNKKCLNYFSDSEKLKKTKTPKKKQREIVISNAPTLESSISRFVMLDSIREHTEIRVDSRFGLFNGGAFPSQSQGDVWVLNKLTEISRGRQSVEVEIFIPAQDTNRHIQDQRGGDFQRALSNNGFGQLSYEEMSQREGLPIISHLSPSDETGLVIQKKYNDLKHYRMRTAAARHSYGSNLQDPKAMLLQYLKDVVNRNGALSQETLESSLHVIMRDADYMNQVRQYYSAAPGGAQNYLERAVQLSNEGLRRYFYFIPDGQSYPVVARILDIGRKMKARSFFDCLSCAERERNAVYVDYTFLVEWIDTKPSEDGLRTRYVGELNRSEIGSIFIPDNRAEIEQVFRESLSMSELRTLDLAASYRLETFGFKPQEAMSDLRANGQAHNAGLAMDFYGHKVSLLQALRFFGKPRIVSLLTDKEKTDIYNTMTRRFGWMSMETFLYRLNDEFDFEVFDNVKFGFFEVMSRYLAKDILTIFEDKHLEYRYIFVVTEDGQIKVSPFGRKNIMEVKPEILRLAQGRRVYAGGDLYFDLDGSLILELNAHEYMYDEYTGRSTFYSNGNQHELNQFLVDAFALQTGRVVRRIGMDSDLRVSDNVFQYAKLAGDDLNQRSKSKTASLKQDAKKESFEPMTYEEWSKKSGLPIDRQNISLGYAFYVLGANENTSMTVIKKNKKLLLSRFHPDKTSDEATRVHYTEISQRISEAFHFLEKNFKDRN